MPHFRKLYDFLRGDVIYGIEQQRSRYAQKLDTSKETRRRRVDTINTALYRKIESLSRGYPNVIKLRNQHIEY